MRASHAGRPRMALLVPLTLGLLAAGCAPRTRVVDSWRDPNFGGAPVRTMMVYRANSSPVNERIWEDTLVRQLAEKGVHAVAFYTLNAAGGAVDSAAVRAALATGGFDSFLMVARAGVRQETRHMSPAASWGPGYYPDPFWGAWRHYNGVYVTPGYTETDKIIGYDVQLFTSPAGEHNRLIWSGQIESRNPGTPSEASQRAAKKIVAALKKGTLF